MKSTRNHKQSYRAIALLAAVAFTTTIARAADPLPSWNNGSTKMAIQEFVAAVTDKDNIDYVEPTARIAVFDHDGTLWVEYPMYTQVLFAFERVKELAPQHPEWKTTQPFKALLEGEMDHLPEQAFYMVGGADDVVAKAKELGAKV